MIWAGAFVPKQTSLCHLSRCSPSSIDPRASLCSSEFCPTHFKLMGNVGLSSYLHGMLHFCVAEFIAECRQVGHSRGSVKWAVPMPHWMNVRFEASWGFSQKASLQTLVSSSLQWRWGVIKPKHQHLAWWLGRSRSSANISLSFLWSCPDVILS